MSPSELRSRRAAREPNDISGSIALSLWSLECVALRLAYEAWVGATGARRATAHAAYLGALEREQRAADGYAETLRRRGDPGPATARRAAARESAARGRCG